MAPFKPVVFKDFFIADQLTSLAIVFYDVQFTTCFYSVDAWNDGSTCENVSSIVRPLTACIPAFWRVLQCLRMCRDSHNKWQLVNTGKYVASILGKTPFKKSCLLYSLVKLCYD